MRNSAENEERHGVSVEAFDLYQWTVFVSIVTKTVVTFS